MGLNIIVTVKQVPDTHNVTGNAMKEDGTVNRQALPTIFNPEDLNALEEAIKIKETFGGKITAVTMGPPKAKEILKECLYRYVDEAILLTDRKFAGADTLATSYALKTAIEKIRNYDLILCGRQAIDGDTAQVGPQIAEKLGINQLTYVSEIKEVTQNSITLKRSTELGYEILKTKLPALLTVIGSANEPRSPSAKCVMRYKNIEKDESQTILKEWNIESINASIEACGLSGSPTKVAKIDTVVLKTSEAKTIPNTKEGITDLMNELVSEHILG